MRAYVYLVHKLLRVLDRLPPETAPAAVLATIQLSAVLDGLPGLLGLAVGSFVCWYLNSIFEIHVCPELPPEHQRSLLKKLDLILLKAPSQDHPARHSDAAFSRNSKRHPHW